MASKEIRSFRTPFKGKAMQSCRRLMKRNIELPGKSRAKFARKGHFAKRGKRCFLFSLLCSARHKVNRICKSSSRKKARGKRQHSAEDLSDYDTFRSTTQVSPTFSQPQLAFFQTLKIWRRFC